MAATPSGLGDTPATSSSVSPVATLADTGTVEVVGKISKAVTQLQEDGDGRIKMFLDMFMTDMNWLQEQKKPLTQIKAMLSTADRFHTQLDILGASGVDVSQAHIHLSTMARIHANVFVVQTFMGKTSPLPDTEEILNHVQKMGGDTLPIRVRLWLTNH